MSFNEGYTDVVIIGAGISGISAAKVLKKAKTQFMILEASHKIGGRAHSQELTKNNWFDLGCSYIHNTKINPFVSIAKAIKFPIDTLNGNLFDSRKTHHYLNGKQLNFNKSNPIHEAETKLLNRIKMNEYDSAISEYMNRDDPYFPVVNHLITNLNAADPDLVSAKDFLSSNYDGLDYPVPNGFGNLVKEWSSSIPVDFNTTVSEINWEGNLIKIKTSKGLIITKKVIITVSTGILIDNAIKISPELPKEKLKAINDLPMGTLNKIGISFTKKAFSKKEQGWYISWSDKATDKDKEPGSFEVRVSGNQNAVVFVGGRFGEWLESQGPSAMIDYAISKIESVFGQGVSKYIQNTITTAWASDPLSKGSYSYARPQKSYARSELAKPIEHRIYFAGEATELNHFGTAHGAYLSGKRVADEIIRDFQNKFL